MNKTRLQTEFLSKDSEVLEDTYNEMLGVLPPRLMRSNGFLVGEPMDHNAQGIARYELYFMHEGKYYYGGKQTVTDFLVFCIPDMSLLNADKEQARAWVEKAQTGEVMRIM